MVLNVNTVILHELQIKDGCCCYCGKRMSYEQWCDNSVTVDHVIAKCNGGTDSPLNRLPCCRACNFWKADNSLDYFLDQVVGRLDAFSSGLPNKATNKIIRRLVHMSVHVKEISRLMEKYKKEIFAFKAPAQFREFQKTQR